MSEGNHTVWPNGVGVAQLTANKTRNPYSALRPIFDRLGIKEGDQGALKIDCCDHIYDPPRLYPLDSALVALLDRLDKVTK